MGTYAGLYRLGLTPWERYGRTAAESIAAQFDRESAERERPLEGKGVTALSNRGSTLLMLAFGPTRLRSLVGGVSQAEVEAAFPQWELIAVEPADTAGLGWPMSKTSPMWYRLRRKGSPPT